MATEKIVHVIDDDDALRDSLEFMLDAAGLRARSWESAIPLEEGIQRTIDWQKRELHL